MADLKRQFLDYAGLSQFWSIIDHKFATKVDAAKVGSFKVDADRATKLTQTIIYTDANDAANGTATPATYEFTLPAADETQAGLLSADHFALIDDIDNKINDAAPFHGLKIEGNEIARDGDKRANIGLDFVTEGSVTDGTRKAYIDLKDLNYPATGTWTEISADQYNANSGDAIKGKSFIAVEGDTTTYYVWSNVPAGSSADDAIAAATGAIGPMDNMKRPLVNRPLSRIDVTELVKAGLLQDADVVLKDGAMYLKLEFIIDKDGVTKEVFINVTDLVDIYNEGEGISINQGALSADEGTGEDSGINTGSKRESVINLVLAPSKEYQTGYASEAEAKDASGNWKMGAVRLGYTTDSAKQQYRVQRDEKGNAFVAVPWTHTAVAIETTEGTATGGSNYLEVGVQVIPTKTTNVNGEEITTNTYALSVEAGEGIKNAEKLAGTSIQDVKVGTVSETAETGVSKDAYIKVATEQKTNGAFNIGKNVTVELTDSAKASLALADTSVQAVATSTIQRGDELATSPHVGHNHTPEGEDLVVSLVNTAGAEYADEKGQKTIKVTLGDKTIASLDKADTALQSITIMGTKLDIDDPTYDIEEAVQALSLGSAAYVNTADAIPGDGHDESLVPDTDAPADAAFKTQVKKADGSMEDRYYVATAKAVKTYVDAQTDKYHDTLTTYVDSRINSLDTVDAPDAGQKPHVTMGSAEAYYNYSNDTTTGGTSQKVFTQIGQTDGILDQNKAAGVTIGIQDICDFAPISLADILAITGCTNTDGHAVDTKYPSYQTAPAN